jgi:calnexin
MVPFVPAQVVAPFLEQFTDGWDLRWAPSAATKKHETITDETILRYSGEWVVEMPKVAPAITDDLALVVKTASAHSVECYLRV